MKDVTNITKLDFSSVSTKVSQTSKMPAQLEEVANKTLPELGKRFRSLLDTIDDSLFQMANQAENNIDQSHYFDAMREIRIKRRGMEKRFNQSTKESFRKLINVQAEDESSDFSDVSFDKLSLLQNDVLEEKVAFSAMSSRATERVSVALMQLNTRINSILGNQVSQIENNPLGPTMICLAMSEAIQVLDLEITAKLILLKLFEQKILDQLDKTLDSANGYLIEMGVLPEFVGVSQANQSGGSRQRARASKYASGQYDSDGAEEEDVAVLNLLQDLLRGGAQSNLGSGGSAQAPMDRGVALSSSHLMALLSSVQKTATAAPGNNQHQSNDTLAQLVDLIAQRDDLDGRIGQPDQDMIQLVSMLFDVVLEDRNLADAMKVLIGRLQIPMIRIALNDESFFTKKSHPARRLLNEIATSTIGWSEQEGEIAGKDQLYKKIEEIVEKIVNEFDGDTNLINQLLTDFMEFIGADRHRTERVEKRTRDVERGRARKEHARFLVQEVINQYAVGKHLPDFLISFLRNAWSNRMFLVLLKEGKDSEAWDDVQNTVETLVWSVLVHEDSARKELFQRLPGLLQSLETGLKEISYNPSEMDKFFSSLEEAHLQFGRNAPQELPIDHPQTMDELNGEVAESALQVEAIPVLDSSNEILDQSSEEPSFGIASMQVEEVSASTDEFEALLVESASTNDSSNKSQDNEDEPDFGEMLPDLKETSESDIADIYIEKIDALEVGNWVNFTREQSTPFRCKLVAILQPSGQHIFVNRNGVKVEERVAVDLAAMLHNGELEILDDGQLFDRALESVIVGLRERNGVGA